MTDQLLLTYNEVTLWYDAGFTVDLMLFDYVKAFDRVDHPTLINKLASTGISRNQLEWIESFLTGRTMCVSLNGVRGETLPVTSGTGVCFGSLAVPPFH